MKLPTDMVKGQLATSRTSPTDSKLRYSKCLKYRACDQNMKSGTRRRIIKFFFRSGNFLGIDDSMLEVGLVGL